MRSEEEMVAYALEIDTSLLPFAPELLADFNELGSDAEDIVAAIKALDLPASASVVDLGCGKGAVAVAIAEQLHLQVTGIDLFAPFITECQARAIEAGVGGLCTFIHGDAAKLAGIVEPADVVVYAALGDTLGPITETMGIIRKYSKAEAYIIVSDGYLQDGKSNGFPGFENMKPRDEILQEWMAHGEVLVAESAFEGEEDGEVEAANIWKRAAELAERHPELKDALLDYARSQSDEYDFLAQNMVSALWTFRKGESDDR
jgi:SAM-dependent methyltransferase